MIKISLLHPSHGRPVMASKTAEKWILTARNPKEIEYIIGLDNNDPSLNNYQILHNPIFNNIMSFVIDVGDSTCAISALNRIAKTISNTSELLIEICDDIDPMQNWDIELINLLKDVDNFKNPKMIGTHDGLRDYGIVFTQPIMNKAAYEKLGFMIYPEYTSVFADNDFTEVARRTGWLVNAPHILFKHNHYTIGLNPIDDTYKKRNNNFEFTFNHNIYQQRHNRNFDL